MGRFDMDIGPSLSDLMTQKAVQQAQIGAIGQESQLRQLQMQTAQQGQQDTAQLRSLLPQLMQSGDPQGTLKSLMMSGNPQAMEMAGKMAPILTAMQKDTKTTWQDGGDKLVQLDYNGQPTGATMPKGAAPKERSNWSQPFNMAGATVQRNEDTGEIRQAVARAPITNINNQPAPTMTEIVDPTNPGQLIRVDARMYQGGGIGSRGVLGISGKTPESASLGKALPSPAIDKLAKAGTAVEDTQRLTGSFKPGYGGKTVLGDMSNVYKRIVGDETGQAQWWQDMDALQNQTRHDLFGSALTATELKAWEKTSITPRMDAEQIKTNLSRRQAIEARAASKLARSYSSAGYNQNQIDELLGSAANYVGNAAPVVPGGGVKTSPSVDSLLDKYK